MENSKTGIAKWFDLWQRIPIGSEQGNARLQDRFSNLTARIEQSGMRSRMILWRAAAVAAMFVLLPVSVMLVMKNGSREAAPVAWNQIYVPRGERQTVVLPDNSIVNLNSDSFIMYPETFSGERTVYLNGEAKFDVVSDADSKFVVNTQNAKVVVHGTVFNVRSYSGDDYMETSLYEGAVDVMYKSDTVRLVPGNQLLINNLTDNMEMRGFDVEDALSWTDGSYVFRNSSLDEIVTYLQRLYNVRIYICDTSLLDKTYFVAFSDRLDLLDMLQALNVKSDIEIVRKSDDVFELHKRQ